MLTTLLIVFIVSFCAYLAAAFIRREQFTGRVIFSSILLALLNAFLVWVFIQHK